MIEPLVLGNRYELRGVLGSGGMGRVWRAWDASLRREVAVKTMGEGLADDHSFRLRFEREAQHAASLNHPNIVQVHDYGIDESTPYIIMELVAGNTLHGLISGHTALGAERTVQIAEHVLAALDHSHHKQIVHRDVKPQNILIADGGTVKVTDFGLAKSVTDTDLTLTGNVIGTPTYISPEQASDEPLTPSSDLYSVGCVLYQCLAGRPPFVGQSKSDVVSMHVNDPVPPLRDIRPDISPALEAPIMQSLAKDPHERFDTAQQMSVALRTALATASASSDLAHGDDEATPVAQSSVRAEELVVTDVPVATYPGPEPVTQVVRPHPWRKGRSLVGAGAGLLAAVLFIAFWIARDNPESSGKNGFRQQPVRLATFEGRSLSIKYPAGWRISSSEETEEGGLVATEMESPNDSPALMKIHTITQGARAPEDLLRQNQDSLRDEPRFDQLAVRRFTLPHSDGTTHPAIWWEFRVWDEERSVMLHKTDVFFSNARGDGVALLTQSRASSYSRWEPTFERIRNSIAFLDPKAFGFADFHGEAFTFEYPSSWALVNDEDDQDGLVATHVERPDAPLSFIRAIVTKGEYDAQRLLVENQSLWGHEPGFEQLDARTLAFVQPDGRTYSAIRWEYLVTDEDTGVLLHKVHLFLSNDDGQGVALLTQAPEDEFAASRKIFKRVRRSFALQ